MKKKRVNLEEVRLIRKKDYDGVSKDMQTFS